MTKTNILELVKLSLWGEGYPQIDRPVYDEMCRQAIIALPTHVLSQIDIPVDIKNEWKNKIFQTIAFNTNYQSVQLQLPLLQVPYVILKGTAAAQYYPHPEYRAMGDIDIMTKREDYSRACDLLLENKWRETTSDTDQKRGRHRTFEKNGFVVEVHAFFASMNNPGKAKYFDDLIVENITDSHILPDMINGLVLIDHVNQHMEEGIGLRQIIDWMMFVDKCLPDEKWPEFETIVKKTGLEKLAITTTRMCELYLGLSSHKWCADVDECLCRDLMSYVMECGNFGIKKDQNEKLAISRSSWLRHPGAMLKELQKKGVMSWETAKKYSLLKCFAWAWQGVQYLKETPRFSEGYTKSRKLNRMFNKLGVKRDEKGLVYFVDGEYIKQ